jgi:hypothetical protein
MAPIIHSIKPSFAGGEASPSLYSRVDIARYSIMAKRLRNFFCHASGGASNRPGFYYTATAKYDGKECTLFPFEYSSLQNYILEAGDYYVRFYTNDAQLAKTTADAWVTATDYVLGDFVQVGATVYYCLLPHTSGVFAADLAAGDWVAQTIYEIPTPYSETEIAYINYTQSADVLYFAHPRFAPRTISRYAATDWRLELYDFQDGPFMLQNTETGKTISASAVTGVGIILTAVGFTFQEAAGASHVGSLWQLMHNIEGQSASINHSYGVTASIKCGGTWRIVSHGTWTGSFKIERSTDGGTTWTNLRTFTGASDINYNTYGTEDMSDDALPFLIRVNIISCTAGNIAADLTTDPFVQKGIAKITAVTPGGATATADVKREIGIAGTATIDWSEGSWSDYRGWPSTVEFHPQDRLMWANTVTEPQTSWMTKTGNYVSFARSEPLVDSDGITVNLPSRRVNGINGLAPLTKLLALTSSNEWGVGVADDILSPLTMRQEIYGYNGSHGLRPVVIGNRAIYVQAMGQVIRDLGYEDASMSYTGGELSVMSDHLFRGYTIKDMTYQQNPDRLVWCVRSDGKLLSMTYMREQEVLAWTWHDANQSGALEWATATSYAVGNWVTHGGIIYKCNAAHVSGNFTDDILKWTVTDIAAQFESCASIPRVTYDQLWVVIKRGTARYIERQVPRLESTEPEDQIYMDSAYTYDGAAASVITVPSHLNTRTVAILADGNVMPQQMVTGNQITLTAEYSKVHVGIPYLPELETLNIEESTGTGTLQGRKLKVSQVTLRVLNSRGGWIGPDFTNMHEIKDTNRTLYGVAVELMSADIKENLGAGYTDGGRMCLQQRDPLPITVLAIMPVFTVGGTTAI